MVDAATSTIYSSLVIYGAIGILLILVFERYRHQVEVYAPRIRTKPDRSPRTPKRGIFMWIRSINEISDDDLLAMVGVDAFMFLRYLRLMAKCGTACGLVGLFLLCPVYSTAPFNDANPGIRRFTMGNLKDQSDRLWAPFFMAWGYSIFLLYLLHEEYKFFVGVRQTYMGTGDKDVPAQTYYSVIVENVPIEYQSTGKLRDFFTKLFPGQVHSAYSALKLSKVEKALKLREATKARLEGCIASYKGTDHKKIPEVSLKSNGKPVMCCGGKKADAIPFLYQKLQDLNQELVMLQERVWRSVREESAEVPQDSVIEADGADKSGGELVAEAAATDASKVNGEDVKDDPTRILSTCGFVTFRTLQAATIACQTPILSHAHPSMRCYRSPSPGDILWSNLGVPISWTRTAETITSVVLYAGLLFWGTIIAFIAAVSTLSNLAKYLTFINSLDPVSYSVLAGILPVVVLAVFLALLPVIFAAIATSFQGLKSHSAVQDMVYQW